MRPRSHLSAVPGTGSDVPARHLETVRVAATGGATVTPTPASWAALTAQVVAAAQAWAAEVDAAEQDHDDLPPPATAVDQARRTLLDAVHTLDYHWAR